MSLQAIITGKIVGLYSLKGFTDKTTGAVGATRYRVQLFSQTITKEGHTRCELHDVTVPNMSWFKPHFGSEVSFPVKNGRTEDGINWIKALDELQPDDIRAIKSAAPALKTATA